MPILNGSPLRRSRAGREPDVDLIKFLYFELPCPIDFICRQANLSRNVDQIEQRD